MADKFDAKKRSEIMSKIKSRNTGPEKQVRSLLHRAGFRFRLSSKNVPGKPDIVLPKHRAVILVHGCFWHGHDCPRFSWPKTNRSFWRKKLEGNRARDAAYLKTLKKEGWRVCVVWECALRGKGRLSHEKLTQRLENWLRSERKITSIRSKASM